MKTSESVKNIASALSKAQGEMKDIVKGTENPNPQFKKPSGKLSRYASLDAVTDMVRKPCSGNGLFYTQEIKTISIPITEKWSLPIFNDKGEITAQETGENCRDSAYVLTARIIHSSGEWIEYEPMVLPVENTRDAQRVKSSMTLMRRAQLLSIFGLAEEDDDGNAAAGVKANNNTKPAPPQAPQKNYATKPLPNHAPLKSRDMPEPPPGFMDDDSNIPF